MARKSFQSWKGRVSSANSSVQEAGGTSGERTSLVGTRVQEAVASAIQDKEPQRGTARHDIQCCWVNFRASTVTWDWHGLEAAHERNVTAENQLSDMDRP